MKVRATNCAEWKWDIVFLLFISIHFAMVVFGMTAFSIALYSEAFGAAPDVMGMEVGEASFCSFFGIVIVKTPSFKSAAIFSLSAFGPIVNWRSKELVSKEVPSLDLN